MAQSDYPRRNSLVFPILLVVTGAFFLYANYSPAFDPWPILRTYWPLLLIFIGLGKVWDASRRRQNPDAPPRFSAGATIGVLTFVLVLVALLWHGQAFSGGRYFSRSVQHESRTVELQNARSARASLQASAGEVTIRGGSSHLLDADFSFGGSYGKPRVDYNVEDGVGRLTISQDDRSARLHFGHSQNEWNLRFSNNVPLDLKIEMGAGQGNLYFRDIQLTRLNLQMGAGQVDVDLTGDRKGDLVADIQGGVGQATIRLPKNVGVIAHASGGIGSISAPGLKHDGDEYTNDALGKTPATIRLKIEGGIGEINLIQES